MDSYYARADGTNPLFGNLIIWNTRNDCALGVISCYGPRSALELYVKELATPPQLFRAVRDDARHVAPGRVSRSRDTE